MVLAFLITSLMLAIDLGPKSKIISSSSISAKFLTVAGVVSENSLPTTTSTNSGIVVLAAISLASPIKSASLNDLPILLPAAAMKVLAIPPPTINWSQTFNKLFKTVNLVETFEPPTIATIGRAGLSITLPKASNSAANNGPAHATGAN